MSSRRGVGARVALAGVVCGIAIASAIACSSSSFGEAGGGAGVDAETTASEAGVEDAPVDAPPSPTNPDGVPYPTDNIGWKVRILSNRGDRIPNLGFFGYRLGSKTITKIAMSDYLDPERKRHVALVILCDGAWNMYGAQALAAIKESKHHIATLAIMGEGKPAKPPTLEDLGKWRDVYPWASAVLDPMFETMGAAQRPEGYPWVLIVDTRTMEIVYASSGAFRSGAAVDELIGEIVLRPTSY